jgi:hypothetical protein
MVKDVEVTFTNVHNLHFLHFLHHPPASRELRGIRLEVLHGHPSHVLSFTGVEHARRSYVLQLPSSGIRYCRTATTLAQGP